MKRFFDRHWVSLRWAGGPVIRARWGLHGLYWRLRLYKGRRCPTLTWAPAVYLAYGSVGRNPYVISENATTPLYEIHIIHTPSHRTHTIAALSDMDDATVLRCMRRGLTRVANA